MRPSRLPLVLALTSLLLLLASVVLFIWSVRPPHTYGAVLLPLAVAAAFVSAALAAFALLRQRRSARKHWSVTAALVVGCLWVVLLPLSLSFVRGLRGVLCNENMKVLALTLEMYNTDYGTLPSADRWCDALASYDDRTQPSWFVCPERPDLRCGYAFNAALSGVDVESVQDPANVVLLFESDAGWNASGGPELLPERPRHGAGDWYANATRVSQWFPRASMLGNGPGTQRRLTWGVMQKPVTRPREGEAPQGAIAVPHL